MAEYKVGQGVLLLDQGTWMQASIQEIALKIYYKIHYDSYGDYYDEWKLITPDICKNTDGSQVENPEQVTVGTKLQINWLGYWYPSTVIEVNIQKYRVVLESSPGSKGTWVSADKIKPSDHTPTTGSAGQASSSGSSLSVGQRVKVFKYKRWLPSTVLEVDNQIIYQVTYPGWGSQYDDAVVPDACKYRDGRKISDPNEVKADDELNVKWADGQWYAAKVLRTEMAVIKARIDMLPPELDSWVTPKEIQNMDGSAISVAAPSTTAVASGSSGVNVDDELKKLNVIGSTPGYQGDKPQKPVTAIETFEEEDPEDKWQELLTCKLLPQGTSLEMENNAKSLKKPAWSGQVLQSDQYEVSIAATDEDMEYAGILATALKKRGLKVTTDVEELHDARTFLLIYSESTARDENIVRHLTRAAERFNMNETIIVPVVRPGCSARALDRVPDNIAYSLSHTTFINLSSFADPLPKALCAAVNEIADLVRRHSREESDWCVTGVWCCQAIVKDERSGQSKVKDFTMLLNQDGNNVTGKGVPGWKIKGNIQGNILKLKFEYRGEWSQNDEGNWAEDDYMMVGEICAVICNQGYRLEGNYVDRGDAGKSQVPGRGYQKSKSVGLFNATLERTGLSGMYNVTYTGTDLPHDIGIVHRGGNLLILDNTWAFGIRHTGFYDNITKQVNISSNHQFYSYTFFGKAKEDKSKSTTIEGTFVFVDTSGVTEQTYQFKMERDDVHKEYIANTKSYGDEAELMKLFDVKPKRELPIPFTPYVYQPMASDEFAVIICCTKHEKSKADKLKKNLEEMNVKPVTMELSKADKSRTMVVLLSSHTQENKELIDVISTAADQKKPIFNIGLDSWFSIFGENNWKDKELRIQLMNALARLNQTPDTTLERHHSNFHGLVNGVKRYTEQPIYYLTGLWELDYIGEGEQLKSKFTDLHDRKNRDEADTGGEQYDGDFSDGENPSNAGKQLNKFRPLMLFIYFNHSTNEVISANDFANLGIKGKVDTESCQLKLWSHSAKFVFHINNTNDVMYGTYINKTTRRKYKVVANYCSDGMSGIYNMSGSLIGIAQTGGGVATVMTYDGVFPAVVSNGQLIFHLPMPENKGKYSTVAARISNYADGIRLEGFIYVAKGLTPRISYKASQYATRLNRIIKKKDQQMTAPASVLKLVEAYYDALAKKDHSAVLKLITPAAKDLYPKFVFMKEAENHLRNEGKYIRKSAKLVGKREMSTGGQKIGQMRYEFDLDFERRKDWRVYFLINDSDGLIAGLESLEEEARSQHFSEYDVMISYRSWDAGWIDLLQSYLEKYDITVWRDRRMDVGVNWSEDITRAVRKSGCVVSAISENYIASSLCTKEVRMAREIGRTVIPVVLPETKKSSDPRQQLVSSHYKGEQLPHNVARELSEVSWVDFRECSNLNTPDPKDLKAFEKKYDSHLTTLVNIICEINGHNRVADITGEWLLYIGDGNDIEEAAIVITAMDGNKLNGTLVLAKFRAVEFSLDENSYFQGSNLRVGGTVKIGVIKQTFIINASLSADGQSLAGSYQMLETPIEVPIGGQPNLNFIQSHRKVTNGCYRQPVKGIRQGVGANLKASFQAKQVKWNIDMDRATKILGGAANAKEEVTELLKIFMNFDRDGSFELDYDELDTAIRMSGGKATKKEIDAMMKEVDTDQSGTVDFYEYLSIIVKTKPDGKGMIGGSAATKMLVKPVHNRKSKMCEIQ